MLRHLRLCQIYLCLFYYYSSEFWTISSPSPSTSCLALIKEQGSPPSEADSSQSHPLPSKSSGIGSQSSSSQNSLSDLGKRPCRPTTLELGKSRTLLQGTTPNGNGNSHATPQSVPVTHSGTRWHLATPTPTFSQPSSMQSTPSEMQSSSISVSERGPAWKHKRKKHQSIKSIHYKDTEIVDLFKGVRIIKVLKIQKNVLIIFDMLIFHRRNQH